MIVQDEAQHKAAGDGWFESPAPAKAALEQLARSNPSSESLRLYGKPRLIDAVYELRYKDATGAEQRRIIREYLDNFLALALESAWAEKPISLISHIESWRQSLPATDQPPLGSEGKLDASKIAQIKKAITSRIRKNALLPVYRDMWIWLEEGNAPADFISEKGEILRDFQITHGYAYRLFNRVKQWRKKGINPTT